MGSQNAVYSEQTKTWVKPGTYGTQKGTFISQAESTKGQEVYQAPSGRILPTSVAITPQTKSADVARQYGLSPSQQEQIADTIIRQRVAQGTTQFNTATIPQETTTRVGSSNYNYATDVMQRPELQATTRPNPNYPGYQTPSTNLQFNERGGQFVRNIEPPPKDLRPMFYKERGVTSPQLENKWVKEAYTSPTRVPEPDIFGVLSKPPTRFATSRTEIERLRTQERLDEARKDLTGGVPSSWRVFIKPEVRIGALQEQGVMEFRARKDYEQQMKEINKQNIFAGQVMEVGASLTERKIFNPLSGEYESYKRELQAKSLEPGLTQAGLDKFNAERFAKVEAAFAIGNKQYASQMKQFGKEVEKEIFKIPEKTSPFTQGFGYERPGKFTEEVYWSTYKENGKTTFIKEPKSFALTDPSELGLYGRTDLALRKFDIDKTIFGFTPPKLGGILPGGVMPEYAESITRKEYMLASEPKLRQLETQRRVMSILGVTAVAVPLAVASPLAAIKMGLSGIRTYKGITLFGAGVTTIGAGTTYAFSKELGRASFSPFQKDMWGNIQTRVSIKEAIAAGNKAISGGMNWSDTGLGKNLGTYISSGGTRERTFEFAARKQLQLRGLKGGELEEAIGIAKSERVSTILGITSAAIAIEGGSEALGRTILQQPKARALYYAARVGKGQTGIAARKAAFSMTAKGIGIAGFSEGFAGSMLVDLSKGKLSGFSPVKGILFGIGGTTVAAPIGTKIAMASVMGSPAKSIGYQGAGYAMDIKEPFGDVLIDIAQKIAGTGVKGGIHPKIIVPDMMSVFGGRAKAPTYTKTTSIKISPKSLMNIKMPTLVSIKVPAPSKSTVPDIFYNPTKSIVPIRSLIKTTHHIPAIVNVNEIIKVPDIIKVPSIIKVPDIIKVPTNIQIATNIFVPTAGIPGIPAGFGFGKRKPFGFAPFKKGKSFTLVGLRFAETMPKKALARLRRIQAKQTTYSGGEIVVPQKIGRLFG